MILETLTIPENATRIREIATPVSAAVQTPATCSCANSNHAFDARASLVESLGFAEVRGVDLALPFATSFAHPGERAIEILVMDELHIAMRRLVRASGPELQVP